jgi:hypothetical protein
MGVALLQTAQHTGARECCRLGSWMDSWRVCVSAGAAKHGAEDFGVCLVLCRLTAEERRRNEPGDLLVLEHTTGHHEQEHCDSTLPQHFASIHHAHR